MSGPRPISEQAELERFGKLLSDRRSAALWSRKKLAAIAKVSECTIKFIETARHNPTRSTLRRLVAVAELQLTWVDVPGGGPPGASSGDPLETLEQRGLVLVDTALRASGSGIDAEQLLGCRQAREVLGMLARLLESPQDAVNAGATAALQWLLGNRPAPLFAQLATTIDVKTIARAAWLAHLGAAALEGAERQEGGWLRGIAAALDWVLRPQATAPAAPSQALAEG